MLGGLIANPTQFTGVLAFAAAILACLFAASRSRKRDAHVWTCLAIIYFLLLIEVLLGLRYRIRDFANDFLMVRGLYNDDRRVPQEAADLLLGSLAAWLVTMPLFFWRIGDFFVRVAVSITIALLGLFAIETVSLHAIDAILYRPIGGVVTIGWMWAAAAIGVCLIAMQASRRKP